MSEFYTLPLCKPHVSGLTCVHRPLGLCDRCDDEWRVDPNGYYLYGDHPAGLAECRRLDDMIKQTVEEEEKLRRRRADIIDLGDGWAEPL